MFDLSNILFAQLVYLWYDNFVLFCTFISEPLVENVSKKRETEWSVTISYGINLSI